MHVRTRFAPSPTGYLHIGGARTALFSWLYARRHGGQFVLRIEDTDQARSTAEAITAILEGLTWLGLDWDEGPYRQTERYAVYQARADRLLDTGAAYRCWCTAEEVEAKREAARAAGGRPAYDRTCRDRTSPPTDRHEYVVRFRTPLDGETIVDDAVKGRVRFQNAELDDFIIVRSDGSPIYNFCVVVDDVDMRITDVIRGDDHLANTPRQVLLYQALGATLPRFAHVPLILGTDKTRLSKRHGATSVTAYRDMGFLPHALVNYLARLGWSHGDQELFTRAELLEHFALDHVGTTAGVFNPEKLEWVNFQWLKQAPPDDVARMLPPFLERAGLPVPSDLGWLTRVVVTLQERAKTLVEMATMAKFYVVDTIELDPTAAGKHLTPAIAPAFDDVVAGLESLTDWSHDPIEQLFRVTVERHGIGLGKLAQPVRVAVTGTTVSPGLFDVLAILGPTRTVPRLRAARAHMTPPSAAQS